MKQIVLLGSGEYTPSGMVTNQQLFDLLAAAGSLPKKPGTDQPVEADFFLKHFGIETRALSELDETDTQMAVAAAQRALINAKVKANEIDVVVHVTVTPDYPAYQAGLAELSRNLKLKADCVLLHLNLGCAGLLTAFQTVQAFLLSGRCPCALVIASQCASRSLVRNPKILSRYLQHPNPNTWMSAGVFADGAGAVVYRTEENKETSGLLDLWGVGDPKTTIINCPVGGAHRPATEDSLPDLVHVMNPQGVKEKFAPAMAAMLKTIRERWPTHAGSNSTFSLSHVSWWIFHQANAKQIERAVQIMGIPVDRVPIDICRFGNSSAASTLQVLVRRQSAEIIRSGDLVIFLWIGTGNGAQWGYCLMKI